MRTILKTLLIPLLLSLGSFANATTTTTAAVPPFVCTSDADCSNHGICDTGTGVCSCDSGYIENDCSYEQDKQVIAVTVHFFFGMFFGAGHFYIGDDAIAAGKLLLFWTSALATCAKEFTLCAKCQGSSIGNRISGTPREVLGFVGVAGLISSFGWWLSDVIRFGKNKINDSNGKPLEKAGNR